jgi:hypothetical protein
MLNSSSFLAELRNLAVNARSISSATMMKLRKAPVLLGLQRKLQSRASFDSHEKRSLTQDHTDDDDDDAWEIQYDLKRPDQIVIADDNNMYQVFGDSIFTAPQEDILEGASYKSSEIAVLKRSYGTDNRFLPTAGFKATHHSREGRV